MGDSTVPLFSCRLPDITPQMQYLSGLSESVREQWKMCGILTYQFTHQLRAAVQHCVSLGFDVLLGALSTVRPLLNFMDPIKAEQLLLKNAVAELSALPFFSSNWFPGHSYYPCSVCTTPVGVRALFWNKSIGIPSGKCECYQLCRALQDLLQTERIDVEDTKCASFSQDSASSLFKVRQ